MIRLAHCSAFICNSSHINPISNLNLSFVYFSRIHQITPIRKFKVCLKCCKLICEDHNCASSTRCAQSESSQSPIRGNNHALRLQCLDSHCRCVVCDIWLYPREIARNSKCEVMRWQPQALSLFFYLTFSFTRVFISPGDCIPIRGPVAAGP